MNRKALLPRYEPRWPVVLTVLMVTGLLALLPGRIKLVPLWLPYINGIALLIPMVAVGLARAGGGWLRVERTVTLLFCVVVAAGTLGNLANVIHAIAYRSREFSGLELLASGIAVWVTTVLTFSLLYWMLDRGGPEARLNGPVGQPDWSFPQQGAAAGDLPRWEPAFVDYLFLGYSTATAFSTTDVVPMTARAKLLMMLESTISLLSIAVIAARAINILGN
jgi:uncharacterized membrane protein